MDINNILAKAQKLMLDENFNTKVDGYSKQIKKGGNFQGNDLTALEQSVFGYNNTTSNSNLQEKISVPLQTQNNEGIQFLSESNEASTLINSKLPKKILESFAKTPPITTETPYPSVLDGIKLQEVQQSPQNYNQQQSSCIDYNALKFIINECIKDNFKTLNENTSTSTLKGLKISNGGIIQFVDTKGNLYEGKLVLKRKAK